MAVTVANLITNLDTYIGDASTDRISTAERYQLLTEATVWLQEELGNDHMVKTYALSYYDNIHTYKITSAIASLMEGADLRRGETDQDETATHKSSRELAEDIGQQSTEFAWSIERRDGDWFLIVNLDSKHQPLAIASFDSLTADGGTWAADTSTSDATNVTADSVEYKQGSGSINFDITVSQSVNNRATISSTITSQNLTSYENLGAFVFWVYLPAVTNFSSITLYWGSSASAYWSATATTDVNGNAFVAGWNRIAILWSAATATSTPDVTAVDYMRFDFNYTASYGNVTDVRIDDMQLVRPETLTFYYTSWYVGTNSGGTAITAYSATSDIPFYSGQYDQYKYAVAHKAASLAFYGVLRNQKDAQAHEVEAIKAFNRQRKLIPSSVTKESKAFKVGGVNFGKSSGRRFGRRF